MGAGTGLLFIRGASSGGTDLLTLIVKVFMPNADMGKILLVIDGTVVVIATLIFWDIDVALYSIVTIFVSTKVVDAIVQGVDYARLLYVITEKGEMICETLMDRIDRGVTIIPAKGGYTKKDKQILMVAAGRNQYAQTLRVIKETDKDAFIIATSATEVHGEGFKES